MLRTVFKSQRHDARMCLWTKKLQILTTVGHCSVMFVCCLCCCCNNRFNLNLAVFELRCDHVSSEETGDDAVADMREQTHKRQSSQATMVQKQCPEEQQHLCWFWRNRRSGLFVCFFFFSTTRTSVTISIWRWFVISNEFCRCCCISFVSTITIKTASSCWCECHSSFAATTNNNCRC